MGVFFGVGIGVVQPVQDPVHIRAKERRALAYPRDHIEEPFPELAHGKHLVRGVAVQEERLGKQGQVPMGNKENGDGHGAIMDELKVVD
jgi:hypothetical protein